MLANKQQQMSFHSLYYALTASLNYQCHMTQYTHSITPKVPYVMCVIISNAFFKSIPKSDVNIA